MIGTQNDSKMIGHQNDSKMIGLQKMIGVQNDWIAKYLEIKMIPK